MLTTSSFHGIVSAFSTIHGVAQNIDANTLSLQYVDTVKALGSSESTKFISPMEFTNLLNPFLNMTSGGSNSGNRDKTYESRS